MYRALFRIILHDAIWTKKEFTPSLNAFFIVYLYDAFKIQHILFLLY